MNLGLIGEETQGDRVDGGVAPSFVVESTRAIQVIKVGRVFFAPEEFHVSDLEVGPEMTRRVSVGTSRVLRTQFVILQPTHHVVIGQVGRVGGKELLRLRPQVRDTFGGIEEVDGESVGDVAVLHEAEYVIVDVAEELDLGLNTPVVAVLLEGRVLVEHSAVPPAHVVIGDLIAVLNALLLQHFSRFAEEVLVDKVGHIPMFLGNLLCS